MMQAPDDHHHHLPSFFPIPPPVDQSETTTTDTVEGVGITGDVVERLDRLRHESAASADTADLRESLALSYHICRLKLQRLHQLNREGSLPRASDKIVNQDRFRISGLYHSFNNSNTRITGNYDQVANPGNLGTVNYEGQAKQNLNSHMLRRPHDDEFQDPFSVHFSLKQQQQQQQTQHFAMVDTAPLQAEATNPQLPRRAFVSVGATAGFRKLLDAVLEPAFLRWMREYGFVQIDVQCGPDEHWFRDRLAAGIPGGVGQVYGIAFNCFAYTTRMHEHILPCRPVAGKQNAGIVISHAGAGTAIEVSRCGVPLVLVPNPGLLGNHQLELAQHLDDENWAVNAKLDGLAAAVRDAHRRAFAGGLADQDPNVLTNQVFPLPDHQRVTVLDWTALSCYPGALPQAAGVVGGSGGALEGAGGGPSQFLPGIPSALRRSNYPPGPHYDKVVEDNNKMYLD